MRALYQWEQDFTSFEPFGVADLNRLHCFTFGRRAFVASIGPEGLIRQSRNAFLTEYAPRRAEARAWLNSPSRRSADGIVYDPAAVPGTVTPSGRFNAWCGYGVEPKAGDVLPFLGLVLHLCNDNSERANRALDWLAGVVQNPHLPAGTPLAFVGPTAGKNTLARIMLRILGTHAHAWSHCKRPVPGRALFVHCTNARIPWGRFSTLITARERPQCAAFVCDGFAPKTDPAYWTRFNGWLEAGGIESVAAYLLSRTILFQPQ